METPAIYSKRGTKAKVIVDEPILTEERREHLRKALMSKVRAMMAFDNRITKKMRLQTIKTVKEKG